MKDVIPDEPEESQTPHLRSMAEESGITSIPAPILRQYLREHPTPGSVIPKPGANDGSFIVAGTCNKVHSIVPGKGGSLLCDWSCMNFSIKVCEYVLAVAQVRGMLD